MMHKEYKHFGMVIFGVDYNFMHLDDNKLLHCGYRNSYYCMGYNAGSFFDDVVKSHV